MNVSFRAHLIQIVIIFIILLFFLSNATGLLEINIRSGPNISIRSLIPEHGFTSVLRHALSADLLLLFFTGIVLTVFLPVLKPISASILTVVCIIPPVLVNMIDVNRHSLIPMEYSLLTILMMFSINVLISYFRETHSRQKIIEVFGQYVPPEIVSSISRYPEQINLEGESRKLTIFFCDLQDFTGTAEQLNPKQLATLLNEYLSEMSEVLFRYGATIDKYIGDSIMAFWGAPIPQDDHASRAVLSTFEMHGKISRLSERFIKRGWPGPRMGIGINTGTVNVGNMGSKYRVAYTVVGDAVNLAARLEGLTRLYNVSTIVSESTKQACEGIFFRELDSVNVKGKHKSSRIYQPLCPGDEVNNTLHRQMNDHAEAIQHYYKGQLQDAKVIFEQLRMELKNDAYYPVMLNKINGLLKN